MKNRLTLAVLAAASILGIASLMVQPAQSQLRPTPATPSPTPAPAPAGPKLMVPPQVNTAPAQSKNPQGNPSSFDVGKSAQQKAEKKKNDDAALARRQAEKEVAEQKKKDMKANANSAMKPAAKKKQEEEKQKLAAAEKKETNPCKKACYGDPCGCVASTGPTTMTVGTGVPGFSNSKVSDPAKMLVLDSCKKSCTTSLSSCQATC